MEMIIHGLVVQLDEGILESIGDGWKPQSPFNGKAYFSRWKHGKHEYLHRSIINCPPGMVVDHINGDINDNRKINLRICTVKENNNNKKIHREQKAKKQRENEILTLKLRYGKRYIEYINNPI